MGDAEADGAADQRAEHPGDRGFPQAAFEQHHERREREPETDVGRQTGRERLKQRGGIGHHDDEHDPTERKPRHWGNPRL